MHLALSASLAFAAGVAIVVGSHALSQPVAAPSVVASVVTTHAKGEPWKACLVSRAGSYLALTKALNAMPEPAYVEGRVDVFAPCLAEENRLLDTADDPSTARHSKLRGALMLDVMKHALAEVVIK